MTAVIDERPTRRRKKIVEAIEVAESKAPQLDTSFARACPIATRHWTSLHIVLVGCGGTGSWLAPSVVRLAAVLREAGRQVQVTFVDGDRVEQKNIPRQQFCDAELGVNKARTLAFRYSAAWGLPIGAVPRMFTAKDAERYISVPYGDALVVVIGCVDNANARQQISKFVDSYSDRSSQQAPGVWWLDCGNADDSGQVLLGTHSKVQDLAHAFANGLCMRLPSPALQRPELLTPKPEEALDASRRLSCAELTMLNYQALTINRVVATIADSYLWRLLLRGGLKRFATVTDDESGVQKSYYTTPEQVAASVGKTPEIFTSKLK